MRRDDDRPPAPEQRWRLTLASWIIGGACIVVGALLLLDLLG